MEHISSVIKSERIAKGMTQAQLAEAIHVTQDSISLWELGKRYPDTQYLVPLCKTLQISADYLLGLSEV